MAKTIVTDPGSVDLKRLLRALIGVCQAVQFGRV